MLSRSVSNVMGTVSDIMQANIEEKVKRGEISEEEAEKEFENVKKLQIAEAIINTLTGALQRTHYNCGRKRLLQAFNRRIA